MIMMQITKQNKDKLSDYAEKILKCAGKLMQCLEEMEESEGEMNQRMSYRHMGMRDNDEYDPYEDDGEYGSRMGMRSRRGSYSRYR